MKNLLGTSICVAGDTQNQPNLAGHMATIALSGLALAPKDFDPLHITGASEATHLIAPCGDSQNHR